MTMSRCFASVLNLLLYGSIYTLRANLLYGLCFFPSGYPRMPSPSLYCDPALCITSSAPGSCARAIQMFRIKKEQSQIQFVPRYRSYGPFWVTPPDARLALRRCSCSARSPYVPVAFPACCIQELPSQTMDSLHGLDNALNTFEQLVQC